MYYLVQHKFARQQTHGELYQEVEDFYRKKEIQDQMPHLTPSLLIKSGKRETFPQAYCKGRPPWPTVGRRGM